MTQTQQQTQQPQHDSDPALEAIKRIDRQVGEAFADLSRRLERLEQAAGVKAPAPEPKEAPETPVKPWYKTTAFKITLGAVGVGAVVGTGVAIGRSRSRKAKAAMAIAEGVAAGTAGA